MKQSNINAKAATTDATAIPVMAAVDNPVLPPAGVVVAVAVVVFVMVAVAVSTAVFVTNRIVGFAAVEVERSSLWRDDMVMGAGRFPPSRNEWRMLLPRLLLMR